MNAAETFIIPLLQAFFWFDDGLQSYLQSKGWSQVTRPQSMVMANVVIGVHNPSEIARNLYMDVRSKWNVQFDVKQTIGKRYARMDEAGTPFCFTIDTQTLSDQTVTVRYRDTLQQERLSIAQVPVFLSEKLQQK